jgi:hypothetical protein
MLSMTPRKICEEIEVIDQDLSDREPWDWIVDDGSGRLGILGVRRQIASCLA